MVLTTHILRCRDFICSLVLLACAAGIGLSCPVQTIGATTAWPLKVSNIRRILEPLAWSKLVPDFANTVVIGGGKSCGEDFVAAGVASDESLIVAYTPIAAALQVDLSKLVSAGTAQWYDPASGNAFGTVEAVANTGLKSFPSPGINSVNEGDWVLVIKTKQGRENDEVRDERKGLIIADNRSVACTPEELTRLRQAWRGTGPEHDVVAGQVKQASEVSKHDVVFPPEGGQHNQWYQCDQCQLALETVDATHHKCPKCLRIYSGYPYDNVIYSRAHNRLTKDLSACAWAYALTDEARYARRAREILLGYAERYSKYPYYSANMGKRTDRPSNTGGHVFEQTLNEAVWIAEVCEAYALARQSEVFSADDHAAIRDRLLLEVYTNISRNKAGKSNWQTYHNAAFMMIGGVLERADLVRQAIEDKQNGFNYQMQASVLPGGMWYENSWGYHFYTLGAMERIIETARRLGIDLYSVPQVKDMYTVALDYQMADGTLPRFGDATTTRVPGGIFEPAYHHWRDPRFLALLPQGPTWDSVLYGRTEKSVPDHGEAKSMLMTGAGHAILRAGTATAALTFGPFGGFHGHFDKLSFVYFSGGKELGYDSGRARSQAYRLPVHQNWYRATLSHNTVLVDRKSQAGVGGTSELFVTAPDLAAAAASTDTAYPGILHRRLLVLRPNYLLVTDVLTSTDGKSHSFDWLYHNLGESISCSAAVQEAAAPEGKGFDYFQGVRRGTNDGPIQATVLKGADRVRVLVNSEAATEVLVGTGVGESVLERVPLIMVTRHGQTARFAAAINPVTKDGAGEVECVALQDQQPSGCLIRVHLKNGGEELYAYDPTSAKRVVAGIETSSTLLCLRRGTNNTYEVLADSKNQSRP